MNSGSECSYHSFNLGICIYFIETRLFYIQNFSSKRKDCLCGTITSRLRRTSGGISLYDVYFTIYRIFVGTVCKFSRQRHSFQRRFSSRKISCFSCSFSCPLSHNWFFNRNFGNAWILFQKNFKLSRQNTVYRTSCLAVSKLLFRLTFKLRIFDLHAYDCSKPFSDIVSGKIRFAIFKQFIFPCIIIKRLCKSASESLDMSSALRRCNIIYKTISIFTVRIVMLHRNFHCNAVFHPFTVNDLLVKRSFTFIQICDKLFDSAFIVERMLS